MKTNTSYPVFFGLLFLLLSTSVFAQTYGETIQEEKLLPTIFNEFYTGTDDVIDVTVKTDMREWIKKRPTEEYQKAVLSFKSKEGDSVHYDIKIRQRGNIRKQICFFPPLKYKFKKLDLEEQSLMTDFNSFKMVNQCKSSRDNGEFIFREYMAYKLYNLVSPYSMRVQLISIKYVDTEDKSKPYQLYGFIIEPLKEMARRLGGQEIKRNRATYNHLDRMTYVYMTVFQYMIGNTDWSLSNMHNMELIKVPEITKILPVPYDFDYSGFVDTHYAVPFEELPIKDVRQRLYRGNGCSKEEIEAVYQHFSGLKTGIMDYCSQFEHMDEKAKKPMMRFMEEFFETLEHPKKRANAFRRGN